MNEKDGVKERKGGGGLKVMKREGVKMGRQREVSPGCSTVLTGRPGEGGLCSQLKENRHQDTEIQDVGCHFSPNSARTGAGKKLA